MPFEIVRNDLTKMAVDAIVSPTDESLSGGGGVDGSIHRAAGPRLKAACAALGGCQTGGAVVTRGYRLPCKYIIHTVGPVWRGGDCGERELLTSCYRTALRLAEERGCATIAFPLLSTGAFGYPKDQALRVAVDTIAAFLMESEMKVFLVIYDRASYQISAELFSNIAEYIDDHYVAEHTDRRRGQLRRQHIAERSAAPPPPQAFARPAPMETPFVPTSSLAEMLGHLDAGFSETLLHLIDRSGKTDAEIYKKANIDRKLFSKIRSNPSYRPSKPTVIAFAVALELDLEETRDLLARAGFALSRSSKFDVIIEYFIRKGNYDVFAINEALFAFDQNLLGV
ncbi:MAG: macro domain-containing protein [Clostridia bacterium]|nr:macro domain-containing protein [Clostridia bacterium]